MLTPSVALDVWGLGSPDPRGIVNLKRQYAKACALLVQGGRLRLCYAGTNADRTWLLKEGLLQNASFRQFHIPGRFERLNAQTRLFPIGRMLGHPDLYHSFGLFPFSSGRTRVIGTLVDFVPMRVPEFVPLAFTLEQIHWCQWASAHPNAGWIAISERTRQDALSLGRVDEKQVAVVRLGAESDVYMQPDRREIVSTLETLGIREPFLLCVNTLNARKNHVRLLGAWETGGFARKDWTLVLVGHSAGHPWTEDLRAGKFDHVVWLGYLPRPQVLHLYHSCEAFVYPSLYEGFGIPVAEAIVAGKPVMTSHRSPMSDFAGEGAVLVDPQDTKSLIDGLAHLINNASLRARLADHNRNRRQELSIEQVADNLLQAYYTFIKEPH